jgi:hypothetical protein
MAIGAERLEARSMKEAAVARKATQVVRLVTSIAAWPGPHKPGGEGAGDLRTVREETLGLWQPLRRSRRWRGRLQFLTNQLERPANPAAPIAKLAQPRGRENFPR